MPEPEEEKEKAEEQPKKVVPGSTVQTEETEDYMFEDDDMKVVGGTINLVAGDSNT